jgi:hypothetical protein
VRVEHIRRLDEMIVDGHEDEVVHVHCDLLNSFWARGT